MSNNSDVKHSILIAEDAHVQGKKLKYFLEKFSYDVIWVEDGLQALEVLKSNRHDFSLIISDYKMPRMDGIELLNSIKTDPKLEKVPFILLTTFADDEIMLQTLKLQANEFLSKPFRPEELKLRVQNLIKLYEYQKVIEDENLGLNDELRDKNDFLMQKLVELKDAYIKRRELQNELIIRSKLSSLGTMGAGVAHEINNPLTIINSYNSLLEQFLENDSVDEKKLTKINDKIGDAVKRIVDVVNHLQIFSSGSADDNDSASNVNLGEIIKELEEFFLDVKKRDGIRVITDIKDRDAYVFVKLGLAKQMILGTIHNAIDAMNSTDDKTLTVDTHCDDDFVYLNITDTGVGISKENVNLIYDPFFTTKSPKGGMGLGMTLIKTYISECDGSITFESSPGRTTFFLKFKRVASSEEKP